MNRDKCAACGSNDLYHSRLQAQGGVNIGRARDRLAWKWVIAKTATCLSCGAITPYVSEQHLETLRKWKAEDGLEIQQGAEERTGLDPRAVAIAVAILGALASFGFYMMGVIDKLKTH